MKLTHLKGPSGLISWHLIRMQLSLTQYIQTISLGLSVLGHE